MSYRGMVKLPEALGNLHRDRLTYRGFNVQERITEEHLGFVNLGRTVFVPRAFAHSIKHPPTDLALGYDMEGGETRPSLREVQIPAVDEIVCKFREGCTDLVLQAPTGSGKTVMGCYIATELRTSTLILVDQNKLKRQWTETLVNLFGYEEDEIGEVQGKKWRYDCDFTIAMVQSVYDKELDDEFLDSFGLVIFDESHAMGADLFSQVLRLFPQRYRLGLSATPDRKDLLNQLLIDSIQQRRVVIAEDRKPSRVYVVDFPGVYSWYANTSPKTGRYITEVAENSPRNLRIVEIIEWAIREGRTLLVLSDRISQLEGLHDLCLLRGTSADLMLLYTGSENVFRYQKNPTPKGHPDGYEKGTLYTPVVLDFYNRKVRLEKRDKDLHTKQVIFSTYSVFAKGVDAPGIDMGVDATPRSTFVQIHGRILRKKDGKKIPIWVTLRDYGSYRAEYQFSKRVAELLTSNAEVYQWQLDKGVRRVASKSLIQDAQQRAKRLKGVKILTDRDGRDTLGTKLTAPTYEPFKSSGTEKQEPVRRT